jgi:rubrerythrin
LLSSYELKEECMAEDVKVALGILERAMAIEHEGRQFYLKAARTTQDRKGEEMFITLAEDERKHYNLIKRQRAALTSGGRWVRSSEITPVAIDLDKPLFPRGREALEKAVATKSSDWDALLFGLEIESKSYDLYRRAALETSDTLGKQMFEFLAGQEQSHFDILMMRFDSLFGPISWRY